MTAFDSNAFDTEAFSSDAFDFGAGGPDVGFVDPSRLTRFRYGFRIIIFFLLISL